MNSRSLVQHTQALLKEYESIRLGIVKNDDLIDRDKRLTQPIAAEEEDILERYLEKNKVLYKSLGGLLKFLIFCAFMIDIRQERMQFYQRDISGLYSERIISRSNFAKVSKSEQRDLFTKRLLSVCYYLLSSTLADWGDWIWRL